MADIFDELLLPTGEPPAPELINALRRQRNVGQIGALSGDKNIRQVGAQAYDSSLAQATDLRDRKDREGERAENRAFQKWQQAQADLNRKDMMKYRYDALEQAKGLAQARQAAKPAPASEFQKRYDRDVAKGAAEWDQGGSVTAQGAVEDLTRALQMVSGKEELGSSLLTRLPGGDAMRTVFDKQGVEAQRLANRVTVENLRNTFGPAFTQKEGEAYQALDYDPALTDEQNARNLEKKLSIINRHIQQKNALFEQYRDGPPTPQDAGGGDVDSLTDQQLLQMIMQPGAE